MQVIIIEDEPIIIDALEELIKKADPTIRIVARLCNVKEAIEYLENNELPDLFFSDIELTDGLSFEIFENQKTTVPIIFCTAYNRYALDAFQVYGIDYLLKPFKFSDIRNALEKYKLLSQPKSNPSIDYQNLLQQITQHKVENKGSVLLYSGDKIIPLQNKNVALVELNNGIVYVHTFTGERFSVNYSMEKIHAILGEGFYRVNRQYIINRHAIRHISQYFARKVTIKPTINFSEKLIVSKARASDFLRWLEKH